MFNLFNTYLPIVANNAPALQVAVPMILAVFCVLSRCAKTSFLVTVIACSFCLLNATYLFESTSTGEIISYHMGGWPPPIGIEYSIDMLNSFMILIVSFFSIVILPFAYRSIESEIDKKKVNVFYCLYLLCFAGLLGILSTNDIFNIYVFLEISSLTTYTLISMGRDRRALSAAFSYLILGTIGATLILIAIGLLYVSTGSLNLSDIANILNSHKNDGKIIGAFAFLTIGIVLKIALFPLHIWLTNAYAYSPSAVSSFLCATATKVSLYVFLKFVFLIFGYELSFNIMHIGVILIIFSVAALVFGNLSAIYNQNLKRLLAFSSVGQMGYISLMIAVGTHASISAGLIHIANHGLAKSLLFVCAGCILHQTRLTRIADMKGLGKQMPLTFAGIIIGGLSLIGVPLTPGFISKWQMVQALAAQELYYLIAVIIIASVMAVIYVWKIVEVLYFNEVDKKFVKIKEVPNIMKTSIILLIIANIYFGIFPEFLIKTTKLISGVVLGL
jgi:multicomponent Na+:H+ antiporter subunit D